jgi:rare lipoprotein A
LTVTNPKTGQSVTVVVNDRGPFVPGVSLDLSLGAAQAIGMRGVGAVCIL